MWLLRVGAGARVSGHSDASERQQSAGFTISGCGRIWAPPLDRSKRAGGVLILSVFASGGDPPFELG